MGGACTFAKNRDDIEILKQERTSLKKHHMSYDSRMSKLKSTSELDSNRYAEEDEEDQVYDRPDLGIYDTRVWDRSYF